MVLQWLCRRHLARSRTSLARVGHLRCSNRQYATAAQDSKQSALSLTRNIGIIAHIDAVCTIWNAVELIFSHTTLQGKTTTTERCLYYANFTRRIGGE